MNGIASSKSSVVLEFAFPFLLTSSFKQICFFFSQTQMHKKGQTIVLTPVKIMKRKV